MGKERTMHIILHLLPWEIDEGLRIAKILKESQYYLDSDQKLVLNAWLNLSSKYVDWETSKLYKSYFKDKFRYMKWFCEGAQVKTFFGDTDEAKNGAEMGINHARRLGINYPADYFLFLDPDCLFKPEHIKMLFDSAEYAENLNEVFLICPSSIPRETKAFDQITNNIFKRDEQGKIQTPVKKELIDPYNLYRWDAELRWRQFGNIYPNLERVDPFIFNGGSCNLFSADLLQFIGIPEFLGSYGRDDHWILQCMRKMKEVSWNMEQWVIQNALVGENYKYRATYYQKSLTIKSKTREEFNIAEMEPGLYQDTKLPIEVWGEVKSAYKKVDEAIEIFGAGLKGEAPEVTLDNSKPEGEVSG